MSLAAEIRHIILNGLAEDLGSDGDITTLSTIDINDTAVAKFLAKANGVIAGLHVAEMVFKLIDPNLIVEWDKKDGDRVTFGDFFGSVSGNTRSIVTAERLALNLLQRMSGIATATRNMVDEIEKECHKAGKKVATRILDTRKTVPGLRTLDKMAVLMGGGTNHRYGLFDMILIKDNHVFSAGGVENAISSAHSYLFALKNKNKNRNKNKTKTENENKIEIEIETRTLEEVKRVVLFGRVDRILLDNMVKVQRDKNGSVISVDTTMLEEALKIINGKYKTEASGNVTLDTVGKIALTGVDYISSGSLTHSVTALDISLKIKQRGPSPTITKETETQRKSKL